MVTTTEQIVREAPEVEARKLGLLDTAKQLAQMPVGGYRYDETGAPIMENVIDPMTGLPMKDEQGNIIQRPVRAGLPEQRVAGLGPQQQRAIELGELGIGAYEPYLSSAQQAIGTGIGTIGAGVGMIDPASAMTRRFGEAQVSPELAQARALAGGATQAYDPTSAQAFMDPYQRQVTQQALEDIRRQADIAAQGQAAQAIRSGAFGGGREGVVRAETERGVQDLMSRRIFEDLSRNYMQAQQAAMGAQEAQQRRALQAAGQLGQLGLSEAQLAEQGLARGIGAAGQLGQLGQALGGLGSQALQAGQVQAGLGGLTQQLGTQDINTLLGLGGLTQQFGYTDPETGIFTPGQAQLEAQRASQIQNLYEPYQRLGFLSDIYQGAPTSAQTIQTQTAPSTTGSPLAQIAGYGIAGLGALGQYNALSNLGGGLF